MFMHIKEMKFVQRTNDIQNIVLSILAILRICTIIKKQRATFSYIF